MSPVSKSLIRDRYDELGGKLYDVRYTDEQREKYGYIYRHLGRGKTLDNGCGTGLFLNNLDDYSVGLDFSSEMLREARSRVGEHINLVQADSENLPFRDDMFDNMVSVTVIQNLPNPGRLVKESSRVTRENGVMVISSLKRVYSEEKFRALFETGDVHVEELFTLENINDLIAVMRPVL